MKNIILKTMQLLTLVLIAGAFAAPADALSLRGLKEKAKGQVEKGKQLYQKGKAKAKELAPEELQQQARELKEQAKGKVKAKGKGMIPR